MKKLLALLICLIMIGTTILTSCNSVIPDNTTGAETTETTTVTTEESQTTEPVTETTEEEEIEENKYKKAAIDYDSVEYVHFEESTYLEYEEDVREFVENDGDFEGLLDKLDVIDEFYSDLYAMRIISEINYYKNTTNTNNKNEYDYTSELLSNIRQKFIILLFDLITNEKYEENFVEEYGEEYIQQIKDIREELTDELVEISNKIDKLVSDYMELETSVKISYNGLKYNIDGLINRYQKGLFSYDTVITLINQYYHEFCLRATDIYIQLIELYKEKAKLLGYDDVITYFYEREYSRDYGEEEAEKMYKFVKEYIVPLQARVSAQEPSDSTAINNWSALTNLTEKYMRYIDQYFEEVSEDMTEAKEYMEKYNLMYRSTSSSTAGVSFTTFISTYDIPYVFINEDSGISDIYTYIHEFGHFYSYYVSEYTDLNNLDIAEIASQANELLFAQKYIEKITGKRAFIKDKLGSALDNIVAGAMMDEFQRKAFREENLTNEKLCAMFEELVKEYSYYMPSYITPGDYWSLIPHNFQAPFYYISYATSVFPAIELFEIGETDREKAIELYNKIVKIDDEIAFLELLEECELSNPFEEEAYINITNALEKYKS